jgi:VWFA-related protein
MRGPISHVIVLAALAVSQPVATQQPTYKSSVDIVRVTATVTTDSGREHVRGLTKADFIVEDAGREQPITLFSAERQPVSVLFLLDNSLSMRGTASEHAREAILTFVREYFGPSDEAMVCAFNSAIACANRWTRDARALAFALRRMEPRGATRLFDAIAFSLQQFDRAQHHKQVLVLMSDGKDLNSAHSAGDIVERMRGIELLTYAIAFPSSDANQLLGVPGRLTGERLLDLPALNSLTRPTGGNTIAVNAASRISEAVRTIVDELGNQYLLGYAMPPGPPRYREITVRLKKHSFNVRARRGYVAGPIEQ